MYPDADKHRKAALDVLGKRINDVDPTIMTEFQRTASEVMRKVCLYPSIVGMISEFAVRDG